MNNNIHLCKAKRIDNGEWVEGYFVKKWIYFARTRTERFVYYINWLVEDEEKKGSYWNEYTEVDPSTICRSTGYSNKFKTLYEGDMFWVSAEDGVIGIIEWKQEEFAWFIKEVPNTKENEFKPDINTCIWYQPLSECTDKEIFDYLECRICNIHDKECKEE